jgi:hypothetical protein
MEVSRQTLETIFADIVNSVGYKTTVGPIDKSKVTRRLAGQKTELPSARLARAAWRVAAILTPLIPPPTYLKVAPRVAHKQNGSDARFCLVNQPGVVQRPDGKYTDESGAVYTNLDGLDESGIRSGEPAPTGAKEIDGRPYCSLPTEGDPTKNTGSWKI